MFCFVEGHYVNYQITDYQVFVVVCCYLFADQPVQAAYSHLCLVLCQDLERSYQNPSTRAIAKILRARASELSSHFCEHFKQTPNFAGAFKLNGSIQYHSWYGLKFHCKGWSPSLIKKTLGTAFYFLLPFNKNTSVINYRANQDINRCSYHACFSW